MADLRTLTGRSAYNWAPRLLLAAAISGGASLALGQMPPGPGPSPAGVPPAAKQMPPPAVERIPTPPAEPTVPGAANPGAAAGLQDTVVDVKFVGAKKLPMNKILPHVRTRIGRPFDLELIAEDVRRLDHTGMFVDIKTYWQQVPGGRVVIFDLMERPLLQDVLFVGCGEIRKTRLQKEAEIKKGDALNPFAIEEARAKIEDYYHKHGYSNARVSLLEGNKPEDRRAIFLINEGGKQQVVATEFVGNTIADDGRLRTQIGTSRAFPTLPFGMRLPMFGGDLDRKKVEEDVEKLTAYYRGLGFFRARIGHELSFNEKQNWVTVTYVIDEGPRYKVRNVSVIGETKYTSEELLADTKLKNGEYFNQAKMAADQAMLQDMYGGVGYVFADVKADPRFLEEPAQLDLVYNIKEGDRYRVGKINVVIKGEYPHTQLTTVLNRLSLKPGDIVDTREIRASQRRLRACGLFEANPVNGNAPKIVFNPPGQEAPDEEELAEKPKSGSGHGGRGMGRGMGRGPSTSAPGGPDADSADGAATFRGQSPDPEPRDRVLDITLDCGRYVGPTDNNADYGSNINSNSRGLTAPGVQPANSNPLRGLLAPGYLQPQPRPQYVAPDDDRQPCPTAVAGRLSETGLRTGQSDSLWQAARDLADAAAQWKRSHVQPSRVQYLAPDDNLPPGRPLPRNSAPGDRHASDRGDTLWQTQRDLHDAAAQASRANQRPLPRDGLIPTQYSPDGGRVSPASQSEGQWSPPPPPPAGANAGSPPPAGNYAGSPPPGPAYSAGQPPAGGQGALTPALSQGERGTQAAPVQPNPAYGQPAMWPSQAPQQPVPSPQGPYLPGPIFAEGSPFRDGPPDGGETPRPLPVGVITEEAMTGRLMFGVGINSDAGLVGSIVLDEQNFSLFRWPSSWEDIRNGSAWRGAGQRLRIEAVPSIAATAGTAPLQRYMIDFTEPYLLDTAVSLGLSGYYYTRQYTEYLDQRIGGRVTLGYQFAPDLSGSISYRGEKVNISNPIDPFLPALAEVTGRDLSLHSFSASVAHDTRDSAFLATEGHLIQASVSEVLGSFTYPHAEIDLRKYFGLYERPDGSGRHVLTLAARAGVTGDNTPIYERYYAGGFSSIRGFQFRGVSPTVYSAYTGSDVFVGGDFELFASAEYMFPITADDMIRGVVFCDTGTVEPTISNWSNKYRVAPGFGLRVCVPAMGPAPIALDFAFPVSWQPGDKSEVFSFFVGFGR